MCGPGQTQQSWNADRVAQNNMRSERGDWQRRYATDPNNPGMSVDTGTWEPVTPMKDNGNPYSTALTPMDEDRYWTPPSARKQAGQTLGSSASRTGSPSPTTSRVISTTGV